MLRPSRLRPSACLILLLASCSGFGVRTERGVSALPRPAESARALSRVQLGSGLLSASIEDVLGARIGSVEDLLVDARTGELVGVLAALQLGEGPPEARILDAKRVFWRRSEDDRPTLVVTRPRAELAERTGYADAFTSPPTASVSGRIMSVEASADGTDGSLVVKVHDDQNLLHRVLVEPANLVRRRLPTLADGSVIEASGVLTRDGKGKLLIASALEQGGEALVLRDSSGELEWRRIAEGFTSARTLAPRTLRTSDGLELPVTDFVLDRETGTVAFVVLDVEGVPRALTWETFTTSSGRLEVEREDALQLPLVSPSGSVEGYP